jgi:hypothetical protein
VNCSDCGHRLQYDIKRDYTKPFVAILLVLLIVFFWTRFGIYGENKFFKSSIGRLEKKIKQDESLILKYEKAIEAIGNASPQRKK